MAYIAPYTNLSKVTECVSRAEIFKFIVQPWHDNELRSVIRNAFRRYRPLHDTAVNMPPAMH